jgi:hypothetical protein
MKLSPRFNGLYKVLEHIRLIAYHPNLPLESRIHPAFLVSCLKKEVRKLSLNFVGSNYLTLLLQKTCVFSLITTILDRRMVKHHHGTVVEVLI